MVLLQTKGFKTMLTLSQLETANKGQLREAMREAGLGYTGMNNDGMKQALTEFLNRPVDAVSEPRVLPTVVSEPVVVDGVPVATVVPRELPAPPAAVPAKVRVSQPEQHGVKRPKDGTKCAEIWAWCDMTDASGTRPEAKVLRAALPHLDDTTKTVQFYRWRKFNGISGR